MAPENKMPARRAESKLLQTGRKLLVKKAFFLFQPVPECQPERNLPDNGKDRYCNEYKNAGAYCHHKNFFQ